MSAIAQWLENAGINTTVIGLVKPHLEAMIPPRALWVPFELGRPMGAPADSDFQRTLLLQALRMTEREGTQLEDYDVDDPRATADSNWQPPATPGARSVSQELQSMTGAIEQAIQSCNRSSIGISGLTPANCAKLLDQTLQTGEPPKSSSDLSPVLQFRYALDDLKAAYQTAALSNAKPSSRQIHDWFWYDSYLGHEIRKLRLQWMASDNQKLATLGARFTVPHRWRQ